MQVKIDRNLCGSWPPACEECFNMMVRNSVPDRACITEVVDDGSASITALIQSGDYAATLSITPENREAIMREGWIKFANLPADAFDIKPPRAEQLRKRALS